MAKVLYEKDGRIGRITLNRPEVMNAIDDDLPRELAAAVPDSPDRFPLPHRLAHLIAANAYLGQLDVNPLGGDRISPDMHAMPRVDDEGTQVINPVNMVGMGVSVDYGVSRADARIDHLFPEIRASVDDHGGGTVQGDALDQQRGATAAVLWIVGIAGSPVSSNAWYSG